MRSFGVHWKFQKDKPCVLGTYLYNDGIQTSEYAPISPPWGENQRIDLFWGTKLGDNKVGVHLGRVCSSDKNEAVNDKNERSLSITKLGVGAPRIQEANVLRYALDQGVTFIDTGRRYFNGKNEEMVGEVIKGRRKNFVIQSKVPFSADFGKEKLSFFI